MNAQSSQNRGERRARERKDQILQAAAGLFSQKGFAGTTTKEIAQAADLSEGTLYNYFQSKENIFSALMEKVVAEQNSHGLYTKTLPPDTQSFLDALYDIQRKFIQDNRILIKAVLPEVITNEKYRTRFVREIYSPALSFILLQLQARDVLGQIRPVNHDMAARVLVAFLYGLLFLDLLDDPVLKENWDSLIGQSISLLYEGLAPV